MSTQLPSPKYEFPALTAVVLGGTSLSGGEGRPAETAAAILVVSVITNLMTILNYQYPVQLLVQGILLTGAVAFYAYQKGAGVKASRSQVSLYSFTCLSSRRSFLCFSWRVFSTAFGLPGTCER